MRRAREVCGSVRGSGVARVKCGVCGVEHLANTSPVTIAAVLRVSHHPGPGWRLSPAGEHHQSKQGRWGD